MPLTTSTLSSNGIEERLAALERALDPRTPARNVSFPGPRRARGVPKVTQPRLLATLNADTETTVVLGWRNPRHPDLDTVEIWMQDHSDQGKGRVKVGEALESPFTATIPYEKDTAVTFSLSTRLRNGLSTDFDNSPTVTASVTKPVITGASLGPNSVGDSHLLRTGGDKIVVVDGDLVATGISASHITTGTLDAAQATLANVDAATINTGSLGASIAVLGTVLAQQIIGTGISAVTYELISAPNTMRINGTDGFWQKNTTSNAIIQLKNGVFTSSNSANNLAITIGSFEIEAADGAASVFKLHQGAFTGGTLSLYNGDGNLRAGLSGDGGAATGYGSLFVSNDSLGNVVARMLAGGTDLGQVDSGYIVANNSAGLARVENGVDGGDNGFIQVTNDTGSAVNIVGSDNNLGQADSGYLRVNNSSGTTKVQIGVTTNGDGELQIADDGGSNGLVLRVDATDSIAGLYIDNVRVVGPQLAAVTTVSGTADATYSANEVTLINDLVTAVNALISRLQTHGLNA